MKHLIAVCVLTAVLGGCVSHSAGSMVYPAMSERQESFAYQVRLVHGVEINYRNLLQPRPATHPQVLNEVTTVESVLALESGSITTRSQQPGPRAQRIYLRQDF